LTVTGDTEKSKEQAKLGDNSRWGIPFGLFGTESVKRFALNTVGGLAVSAAIATPAVMGTVGLASDFAIYTLKQSELQAAADAAAIAAARELSVIQSPTPPPAPESPSGEESKMMLAPMMAESEPSEGSGNTAEEIARSYVNAALGGQSGDIVTTVEVDEVTGSVRVNIVNTWQPFFAHLFGAGITPIRTHATAGLVGESKTCVIALSESGAGAISMTKDSHLEAKGCSVYSNSTNSSGFYLGTGSSIEADLACSAGGVYDKGSTSTTKLLTDCPKMADPLAGRAKPTYGSCDYTKTKIMSGDVTLKPGVYCGGLEIGGTAQVELEPGEYILKDSLFFVHDSASLKGRNVGFFFTGDWSLIQFWQNATIDLSGAEDGTMAGLLFFEDPSTDYNPLRYHNIRASNAFNLTGTIYLPKANLLIDPKANVAEKSAYTAIIARRLIVDQGPNLVLNSNYSATNVPVPNGIRASADVVLSE
jgi:Flp pilus assembly protein TadG